MSFKTVYQLDTNGFYTGPTQAQESPLEPGVFLIPAGCVEKIPPKCRKGLVPKFNHETGKWEKVDVPTLVQDDNGEVSILSEEDAGRIWRNSELSRADIVINKIEDFEIEGDSKLWRQYRVALRNWPATEDFPTTRPESPDA